MDSIIDKVWTMHEAEACFSGDKANKFKEAMQRRDQLFDMLSEEQKILFEKMEEAFYNVTKDAEKVAFQQGVRFATRYLMESLYGGNT